ncbi:MAG TPA: SPASM domain-containing protein [Nitrospirota bacterium]|nr:SPASM domain-containing protein [Nitrospirota bacterium]
MATVIFKPTEACNARCVYCDVVHNEYAIRQNMSYELLELFFQRINEYLLERPEEDMVVTWHGGEPLLLGPAYFDKALEFQQKHCEKTAHKISHQIQSNLTLFKSEFTPVFKKLRITNFGTSYDPFSNLRGIGESVDSVLYKKKFIEGTSRAEKDGFAWGMIYVVTKLSLKRPLEIFWHLVNLNPWGSVMFNPVYIRDKKLSHLQITPEEFADFLGAIFPSWWKNRRRLPTVQPFIGLEESIVMGSPSLLCSDAGVCTRTHFGLDPSGRLYQCGRSMDWGILDYGSITEKKFSDVLEDPQRVKLRDRSPQLAETECQECRFWDLCHGGCPLDAWRTTGSLMRRSGMCDAKKIFIEKYFEPIVNGMNRGIIVRVTTSDSLRSEPAKPRTKAFHAKQNGPMWINPTGGIAEALILSGVLKHVMEKFPTRKFNVVTRTECDPLLTGHPAIAHIGHPPPGAAFMSIDHRYEPDYGVSGQHADRAYQTLARMFSLETPIAENLWVPFTVEADPVLAGFLPLKSQNVLICPSSDFHGKQMSTQRWEELVGLFSDRDTFIAQTGKYSDSHVRGTYSLLGLLNPKELISLLPLFDAVITVDNFTAHAAHLCDLPAVVLWGPTDHRIYGYRGQRHFQAAPSCQRADGCIGMGRGSDCLTPCTLGSGHCLDSLSLKDISYAVKDILKSKRGTVRRLSKKNSGINQAV